MNQFPQTADPGDELDSYYPDEEYDLYPLCPNPTSHEWVYTGIAYGGDDPSYNGEGHCYCAHCGADGDA